MNNTDFIPNQIQKVAVLGAGTMGAQIAALIAERGVECDLLDLSTEIAEDAKRRLLSMRPRAVGDATAIERIRAGSLHDDLGLLSKADWIIEAIVEQADPKLELWQSVSGFVRDDTILSTNTSGIPIARIAQALPRKARSRFLGTHFFNPPRYLHLLEIIPGQETDPNVVAAIRKFAEDTLDKGVVIAHDVPGFITNRIGCFYFLAAMRAADEYGLTTDEVDAVSGPLMGRSNSATFRTIDLVGVDILLDICDNTRAAVLSGPEARAFEPPEYLREMRRRSWLGNKTGQGFYKRQKSSGESRILALNTGEMRYAERKTRENAELLKLREVHSTEEQLRMLMESDDVIGRFAWRTLSQLLAFSAAKVGEVADDIVSIDRAMRWGFNWELGPFQTWDALGVGDSVIRMQDDGLEVPNWVLDIAQNDDSFYRCEKDKRII